MMPKGWFYSLPAFALAALVAVGGCGGTSVPSGTCSVDMKVLCDTGYLGYSCSGADRPDQITDTTKVVNGVLCSTTDAVNGRLAYCCTDVQTSCGYDARVVCTDSTYGFSCLGTNRPDSFNNHLICAQGIHEYGLISYCCGETISTSAGACIRNTSVNCPSNAVLGFSCTTNTRIPAETELGMNQSRSEVPLICNLAVPDAVDSSQLDYCCYTPSAAPPQYTCLQNQLTGLVSDLSAVPGCKAGSSFGFACLGTQDTPHDDYPRMSCPYAGTKVMVNDTSLWLYCCDYSLMAP